MTTKMKQLLTTLMLLSGIIVYSQSTDFTTTRRLGFNNSVNSQSVEIKSPKDTSTLSIQILCSVENGAVTIEIFNPSGKKEGEFTVESTETETSNSLFDLLNEGVSGEINKLVNDPEVGSWIVKFNPDKATGKVQIVSKLVIYPSDHK